MSDIRVASSASILVVMCLYVAPEAGVTPPLYNIMLFHSLMMQDAYPCLVEIYEAVTCALIALLAHVICSQPRTYMNADAYRCMYRVYNQGRRGWGSI